MTTPIKAKLSNVGQTNIITCRVSQLNKKNTKLSLNKFVAKLLNYRILFKETIKFLGLDYRYASKWTFELSGNDFKVATHPKSNLIIISNLV